MSRRRKRLIGELGSFLRQYRRKRHPNFDPNDRSYDRELEQKIKRMDPVELDDLMHGGADEPSR
jgi:hypothetical protein